MRTLTSICVLALSCVLTGFMPWAGAQEASKPAAVQAVPTPGAKSPEFNLGSTVRFVPAGHCHEFHFADIRGGGTERTVIPQELLTPAEYVALHQVLLTGEQTIKLNAEGKAIGGKFRLDKALADAIAELLVSPPEVDPDTNGMPSHAGKASVVADSGLKDDEYISAEGTSGIITGAAVVIGDRARPSKKQPKGASQRTRTAR